MGMTQTVTRDEANFYAGQVATYAAMGTAEAEAHRVAAMDTANRFRTDAARYAHLVPTTTIQAGDAVMVTLSDAGELPATVVEVGEVFTTCRLARNGMQVRATRVRRI